MKAFIKSRTHSSYPVLLTLLLFLFISSCEIFEYGDLQVNIIGKELQREIAKCTIIITDFNKSTIINQDIETEAALFTQLPAGWLSINIKAYSQDNTQVGEVEGKEVMVKIEPSKLNTIQVPLTWGALTSNFISGYLWSPDSAKIAVLKCYDNKTYNNMLWAADKDLKNPRLLKAGTVSGIYDWQGDWILFTKDKEAGLPADYNDCKEGEFWRIKADGSGTENQVTFTYTNGIKWDLSNHGYDNMGTATYARFIPGTNLVYFLAHNGNGWGRSFICNADGTDSWQPVSYPESAWSMDVSPTGNKLFYASSDNHDTAGTIKSINPDNTEYIFVKGPIENYSFLVLSDGNRVAFKSGNKISVISIYGTGEQELINDNLGTSLAGPGRNGNEILVYSSESYEGQHVYLFDISTRSMSRLT